MTGDQAKELAKSPLKITRFVPNARPFLDILRLVDEGAPPNVTPGAGVSTPALPPVVQTPAKPETGGTPSTPATSPRAQ